MDQASALLNLLNEKHSDNDMPPHLHHCEVANINSDAQIVLSGYRHTLDKCTPLAKRLGIRRLKFLNVHSAFHSQLMEPMTREFRSILSQSALTWSCRPLQATEWISNVTGEYTPVNASPSLICNLLTRQICAPVRWSASLDQIVRKSVFK